MKPWRNSAADISKLEATQESERPNPSFGAMSSFTARTYDYFTATASVSWWSEIRVRKYGPIWLADSKPASLAAAS
jgi:hypothetical protein